MEFITKIKLVFITVGTVRSAWLGILFVPMVILILSNVIDYATGLFAAKYRNTSINSYTSIRGIAKKICMWLLVGVGAILDWILIYSSSYIGLIIKFNFLVACAVAVWLIVHELISILENMKDIGVPLPPFLKKIASNVKSQTENRVDIGDSEDN